MKLHTLAAGALAAAVLLSGCESLAATDAAPPTGTPRSSAPTRTPVAPAPSGTAVPSHSATATPTPRAGTAASALSTLTVRGRAPVTGYSREVFGPAWLDADRNGCDQRNDVLARDLTATTEENCRILTGTLADPYTGRTIAYRYGDGDLVDIDHVVALGNAWVSGAWRWDVRRRAALATDPLNLLAVDAPANRQKGDGDAATWLPSNKSYRCAYVARQVAVKAKFHLSVTPPERDAIARVLAACPGQPLPADSGLPTRVDHHLSDPTTSAPAGVGSGGFASCGEARAAGAAPVHRGDPGYAPHLDGDGDGTACE